MILYGDVRFWLERLLAFDEVSRQHQEPDVVEECGQLEVVQFIGRQANRLADQ